MDSTFRDSQASQVTLPSPTLEQSSREIAIDVKPNLDGGNDDILQSSSTSTSSQSFVTASSATSPGVPDITMAELLERSIFNCKTCGNFFKTAVFAVQGHGIVCETCCKTQRWKGGRLEIYDVILKNLHVVPCAHAGDGCKIQVLPETSALHSMGCKYRLIACVSPGCPWRGKQDGFTEHFLDKHCKDVMNLNTSLDLAQDSFVIAKFLIKNNQKYFLIVERRRNSLEILYKLLSVNDSNAHSASIKHFCNDSDTYTVHIDTQDLNVIDKECAWKKVNFLILKMMFEGNNILSISVKVSQLSKVEEKLRCSGCGKTMRPHIHQCEDGHGICSTCSAKLSQCLICEKAVNKTRHLDLEALTTVVMYNCKYEQLGCQTTLSGDKIAQHESTCRHRLVMSCMWPNCGYKNNYVLFKQHILDLHKNTNTASNTLVCHVPDVVTNDCRSYIYIDDCLFELKLKVVRANSNEWMMTCNIQLLNKELCKSKTYICRFAIISNGNKEELYGKVMFTVEKSQAAPFVHRFRKDGSKRNLVLQFTKFNFSNANLSN